MKNILEDTKKLQKILTPILDAYESTRTNRSGMLKLVDLLRNHNYLNNLSSARKREVLFSLRDRHFLDYAETQDIWLDLATEWEVEKHLPHLINKTKL